MILTHKLLSSAFRNTLSFYDVILMVLYVINILQYKGMIIMEFYKGSHRILIDAISRILTR